jgi:hypothetical protein
MTGPPLLLLPSLRGGSGRILLVDVDAETLSHRRRLLRATVGE